MEFMKRIYIIILALIIVLCTLVGISACNSSDDQLTNLPPLYNFEQDPEDLPHRELVIPVESVEIILESETVDRGALIAPTVIIYPENATDKSFTLYTYDVNVLRKTDRGFLALERGKAEIIVLAADGATNWVEVTVINPVRRVSFDIDDVMLNVGENLRLSPIIFPNDAVFDTMAFYSSDDNIATVSNTGTIRAVALGEAIITCRVDDLHATIIVRVQIPASGILVSTDRPYYAIGDRGTIYVDFIPENTTDQSYEISFSRGAFIVEGDKFEVTEAGELTITVTTPRGITARQSIVVFDLEALANDIFELTNRQRALANLPELRLRRSLTRAADLRAVEITEYFSHTRPDGRGCFTVLDLFEVTYNIAGENLAMGQRSAAEAVADWMDSPSHRDNILSPGFNHIGIGVAIDSEGVIYWTQMFTN